ncbi:MAG: PhzF family phenazine biosynthesis protein [Chloroflexota bacterium]
MEIPIYQADAFTNVPFKGNPAAVCPLDTWLPDETMQAIAAENNLSETAFVVREDDDYRIRWFTPRREAPLCGHATLATAYLLFTQRDINATELRFQSLSGPLTVTRDGDWLAMDFPAYHFAPSELPSGISDAFQIAPSAVFKGGSYETRYYLLYEDEQAIHDIQPNLTLLESAAPYGFAITAPGKQYDCVSRYFSPSAGIPEDPVTGSLHSSLIPYWSKRLNKKDIHAYQASARGGELRCTYHPERERVTIRGQAVLVLSGTLRLPF